MSVKARACVSPVAYKIRPPRAPALKTPPSVYGTFISVRRAFHQAAEGSLAVIGSRLAARVHPIDGPVFTNGVVADMRQHRFVQPRRNGLQRRTTHQRRNGLQPVLLSGFGPRLR